MSALTQVDGLAATTVDLSGEVTTDAVQTLTNKTLSGFTATGLAVYTGVTISGNWTQSGIVTGGTWSAGTLSGATINASTFVGGTLTGAIAAGSATIAAMTLSGGTLSGTVTATAATVLGGTLSNPTILQPVQYAAPTNGATVNATGRYLVMVPAGTIAGATVNFPPTPVSNQRFRMSSTQIITTLTVTSDATAIIGAPATFTAGGTGGAAEFTFSSGNTSWYIS